MALQQPGNLDEGKDDEKEYSTYGVYRCIFRKNNNSLFLEMKNTKNKRVFCNTFSKEILSKMHLPQSVDRVIKLIEAAKNGKSSEYKFSIRFAKDHKKEIKETKQTKTDNNSDKLVIKDAEEILSMGGFRIKHWVVSVKNEECKTMNILNTDQKKFGIKLGS